MTLRALTVWQPWAHALVRGFKPVENRKWAPRQNELKNGDYFAIHAGKTVDDDAIDWVHLLRQQDDKTVLRRAYDGVDLLALPQSAIVGVVRLARVSTALSTDPWFVGPVGWWVDTAVAIDPIPCAGKPGLWEVEYNITIQVRAAWKEAQKR